MLKRGLNKHIIMGLLFLFIGITCGCVETSTENIPPKAFVNADPTSGETPLTVSFTGTGVDEDGNIQSYFWDFGDGTTSNEQNPTHTFNSPGKYYVKLTVTDNYGAKATATIIITVTEKKVIKADFTYSPQNPTTNDIIQFYDRSVSTEGNIVSWYWEFDLTKQYTDDTSTLQNPTYRYLFGYGRTFTVKLTVTDDKGNSDSITKDITIVHQTYIPGEDDILIEWISHWKSDYDLDGDKSPRDDFTYFYIKVKMINNWNRDILPLWGLNNEPNWGGSFYVYTNYDPNNWWGYSSISPENSPEKLAPGESFTWTITFWIPKDDIPYKIEYLYSYDFDPEGHFKEVNFYTYL